MAAATALRGAALGARARGLRHASHIPAPLTPCQHARIRQPIRLLRPASLIHSIVPRAAGWIALRPPARAQLGLPAVRCFARGRPKAKRAAAPSSATRDGPQAARVAPDGGGGSGAGAEQGRPVPWLLFGIGGESRAAPLRAGAWRAHHAWRLHAAARQACASGPAGAD
jgi:hypothetical protein